MNLEESLIQSRTDSKAFKYVYDLTISRVYSFVLLRTKDKALALDICQEIYLALWNALSGFQYVDEHHFYAYLFQIARRQVWKARKKARATLSLDEAFDIPDEGDYFADYRALLGQVEKLKEKERLCIELRYFEDRKFSEIAEALGTSENNAKVIHHRAIKKLKESVSKYE